jgi:hypothetical protein
MVMVLGGSGTANGITSFSSPATFQSTLGVSGSFTVPASSWLSFGSNQTFYSDLSYGLVIKAPATSNFTAFRSSDDTERMRIDSSGRVTTPYRPAFFAVLTAEQAISAATNSRVNFQNAIYNIGSCYSTSSYRFTAPVTGLYQFHFSVYIYTVQYAEQYIYINNVLYQRFNPPYNIGSSSTNPNGNRASMQYSLNANDYVELYAYSSHSGGIWNGGPYSSYFAGHLIG